MSEQPLHNHWSDLYQRRWLVLFTMIVASLVAYLFSTSVAPVYQAKTTFFLSSAQPAPQFVAQTPDAAPRPLLPIADEKTAALDVGILRGRVLLERLSDQVGMAPEALAKAMVVTVSGEFMIDVFLRDRDPERAAEIANAVPDAYAAFHERSMRERAEVVADAISASLEKLEAEREALLIQLQNTRRESVSTADLSALAALQMRREAALIEREGLDAQINREEARRQSLANTLESEAELYRAGQTMETTRTADEMLTALLELRVQLASEGSAPNSPRVRRIQEQVDELERQMDIERAKIGSAVAKSFGSMHEELRLQHALSVASQAGLRAARSAADSRLTEETVRFTEALAAVTNSDQIATRLAALVTQIDTARTNLDAARIQAANVKAPLVVVEAAAVPTRPAFPLPILNAIVAALTALMLGSYFALLLAHNDRVGTRSRLRATQIPLLDDNDLSVLNPAAIKGEI